MNSPLSIFLSFRQPACVKLLKTRPTYLSDNQLMSVTVSHLCKKRDFKSRQSDFEKRKVSKEMMLKLCWTLLHFNSCPNIKLSILRRSQKLSWLKLDSDLQSCTGATDWNVNIQKQSFVIFSIRFISSWRRRQRNGYFSVRLTMKGGGDVTNLQPDRKHL